MGFFTPNGFDFSLKYEIDLFLRSIEFVSPREATCLNTEIEESNADEEEILQILLTFLDQYFSGSVIKHDYFIEKLKIFENMNMKKTKFSQKVLNTVAQIPFGAIETYSSIAKKIGSKAYRAVGNILASNKFPILIPCHRIIPATNIAKITSLIQSNSIHDIDCRTIGGFMGESKYDSWQTNVKAQLLQFELLKSLKFNTNVGNKSIRIINY